MKKRKYSHSPCHFGKKYYYCDLIGHDKYPIQ